MKIGVLGGGLAGLACAHYVQKIGAQPVVFEAKDHLGPFSKQVDLSAGRVDPVVSPISGSDTALCGLLADLDLLGDVTWRPIRRSAALGGNSHDLQRASDLLTYESSPWFDRLRAAVGIFYATRLKTYGLGLDNIPAREWLERVFGRRVAHSAWLPFLERRFGEHAERVPAYWVWDLLTRLCSAHDAIRGYLRGGSQVLYGALHKAILDHGGEVHLCTRLEGADFYAGHAIVAADGRELEFDGLICAVYPAELRKMAQGQLATLLPPSDPPSLRRVTACIAATRRLSGSHETIIVDDPGPFQSILEPTHVIPTESLGSHLVYLSYLEPPGGGAWPSDDEVRQQATDTLTRLFPPFSAEDVQHLEITRCDQAEPVPALGALSSQTRLRLGDTTVFLCSSAQAYPRPASWDAEVTLAREAASEIFHSG